MEDQANNTMTNYRNGFVYGMFVPSVNDFEKKSDG